MDDIGKWNQHILGQLPGMPEQESELILEFTIPLRADMMEHRVGWSLKHPRNGRWVAISTGLAVWHRGYPFTTAEHIVTLLDECNRMLEPQERR